MTKSTLRMSSGAPMPPPVWQLICEFANGYCICAAQSPDLPPCPSVETAATRIRNRVEVEVLVARREKRAARKAGAP